MRVSSVSSKHLFYFLTLVFVILVQFLSFERFRVMLNGENKFSDVFRIDLLAWNWERTRRGTLELNVAPAKTSEIRLLHGIEISLTRLSPASSFHSLRLLQAEIAKRLVGKCSTTSTSAKSIRFLVCMTPRPWKEMT